MGRVMVRARLWNFENDDAVRAGLLKPLEVSALVDTGAMCLVLPEHIVSKLGLRRGRTVYARYADGRREMRQLARGVCIAIGDRETDTYAVIEPNGETVLIGQIVLESFDLLVDPVRGTVNPRPESPDAPMMDILISVTEAT